ncbi:WASH complex subunit 4-like [Eurosta solidaginis]|uniref:WASH complex subunit 4-like n=1 Tax=Eurosta solidaginis TaxID=178769 RepID=UPI0035306B27
MACAPMKLVPRRPINRFKAHTKCSWVGSGHDEAENCGLGEELADSRRGCAADHNTGVHVGAQSEQHWRRSVLFLFHFSKKKSGDKHLDSIGIRHVVNSLRTHGTGVINKTVNFTYQFLRQKFYTFSQFLYDEQIKSRLMKELRAFTEHKQSNNYPLYAYERADAFNKDIRKLGLANDGQTYMDLFRKVITHVGNAMGYIRLVRSGSIHANYSASLYLPKFDENLQFVTASREQEFADVAVAAAQNFEVNITNLVNSFSDSTGYFKPADEPLKQMITSTSSCNN